MMQELSMKNIMRLVCVSVLGLAFSSTAYADQASVNKAVDQIVGALVKHMSASAEAGKKVAVSPLVSLGPTARDKQMGDVVAELIQERLAQAEGIELIERTQLKKILEELKLSLLGLTDPNNAEAVGKLAGADVMIVGSVSEVGADFRVSVRLVNVSNGKIEKALSANLPQESMIALSSKYIVTRSKSDGIFRSVLVPGWGQMYNGENIRGGVYLAAVAGTGGAALAMFLLSNATQADYDAIDTPDQARLDELADEFSNRRNLANIFGIATAVLYGINVIDAAVTGVGSSEVKAPAPTVAVGPNTLANGVEVAWRF